MNQYGDTAMKYWRDYLPERFEQIEDPQEFFSTLGEQLADQIEELADHLAGPDLPGEGYLQKIGRLNVARSRAEEKILAEQVFFDPEAGYENDESEEHEDSPLSRHMSFLRDQDEMRRLLQREVDEIRQSRSGQESDQRRAGPHMQARASDPTE